MTPGWAVSLTGDSIDLNDFRQMLEPSFEPWVEDYVEGDLTQLLLRSRGWSSLTNDIDVLLDARRIVEVLNGGAFLMYADAKPVQCDDVIEFDLAGVRIPRARHVTMTLAGLTVRSRLHGVIVRAGQPAPPQPSLLQQWVLSAQSVPDRADLFASLSRVDTWYDLYKAMEIMRRLKGGPDAWTQTLAGDRPEWKRVWKTANCNRHAPDPVKYPLPVPTPTFNEAKGIVSSLIRKHL